MECAMEPQKANILIAFVLQVAQRINSVFHILLFGNASEGSGKPGFTNSFSSKAQMNNRAETLLKDYGDRILRLAYSYLHNMSDAEDVLQDTLFQLLKTDPQFETADHEKAWIMRVAINISKNKITYNKTRKTDELDERFMASEKQDLAFVWDAVKDLPPNYREVIHLFYHEGYSTAQIAEILSKKDTTIRSLLNRGRDKLKAVLKEVYDFDE